MKAEANGPLLARLQNGRTQRGLRSRRGTCNMVFGQALIPCDGETAVRVSGVLKQGPLMADGGPIHDPLGLRGARG